MLITADALAAMQTGFNTAYNGGFTGAKTNWQAVAMRVQSVSRDETYGFLGQFPKMREWTGPRHIHNLTAHGFSITNKNFEQTISVSRNDMEDDRIGVLAPLFTEMGRSAAELPDQLVFDLLGQGFDTACYDGQSFFDTDHPSLTADGSTATVANTDGGAGTPWYLLDTSRAIRPLIYQERRPFNNIVSKNKPEDDNVFLQNEYVYGVDGRANVGFGLWQLAWGSKQTLDATHYAAARAAMQELRGESGRLLGVVPDTLVVPPSLEAAGRTLVQSGLLDGGGTNPWAGTAKLIVTPWL